jgi:general transcription factor 3C polypeptide 3 (transcription factor C subunit 4)
VIDIDPKNYRTRFQRAAAYRELGHNGRAIQEYERILKDLPHNMAALRHLAEAYIDVNDVEKARGRYEDSIAYYTSLPLEEATDFTWSDVNIYIELFSYSNSYEQGILSLRSLARWLLGRQDDVAWDSIRQDDREWDADHFPRRIDTPWFNPRSYPKESYGLGLPLELRVKLGIYRLKMGLKYREEALVRMHQQTLTRRVSNTALGSFQLVRSGGQLPRRKTLRLWRPFQRSRRCTEGHRIA